MGGLSRYKKFKYIYKNVLKQPISKGHLEKLGNKFSDLIINDILKAPFIPGALKTLKDLISKGVPCFVVSGTPEDEIMYIVQKKGLEKYFLEVHGSPRHKEEIVRDVIKKYNFEAGKCLLVGDSMSDYEAARKTGLNFLGIVKKGDELAFPQEVDVKNKVDFSILTQEKPEDYFSFNGRNFIEETYKVR